MPLYIYKCSDCSAEFEELQSMSSEPKAICPKCSSNNCSRQITSPSVILDGRPSWDRHEENRRYINQCRPKYISDERTGIRKKYPKGGV